ncbi:MAG: DMT family transporter [Lachnospiraceae bacterium]
MKLSESHHPYAMATIIFWSLAYVFTRLTLQYFSSLSLGFIRYFIASCALIVITFAVKMKLPALNDLPWFAAAGAVGFFFYMIAFNKGQATVTAATGSVVIATVPVITALLARFIYGEKLQPYQWLAIAIEFTGVLTLTLLNGMLSVNAGLIWLFSAALALSIYNLMQRKLTKKYTALQTSSFSIFFGTLMLAVFMPQSVREIAHAPAIQIFYVMVLGIFSSAAAYVLWSVAFVKAKQTSQVSNYMFLTPFLTSILGLLLADEIPDQATIIGGVIILFGVFVFNFGGKVIPATVKRQEA